MSIEELFAQLGVDHAPGQESLKKDAHRVVLGPSIGGAPVDFSHGDVNAHVPAPGSFEAFCAGVAEGASQAYTPYRGKKDLLQLVAQRLSRFTGTAISPEEEILLTPGTQGALFLAVGSSMMPGDRVAIVEPDYFANRKLVTFFHGEVVPVRLAYETATTGAGLDLTELERIFSEGVKLFLFSNPNNPIGCIYSREEILGINRLAKKYNVTVIADELYSRQIYDNVPYIHLCACGDAVENRITIIGPSKTESLSGYRLGVAFGTKAIIDRMEKLQAIMALRCSGYNQAVFSCWFNEPEGWLEKRIEEHKRIRDDILGILDATPGVWARPTEGGSYLFVRIPELKVGLHEFVDNLRMQANVIVTPGTEFGPQFTSHFRINFSQDHDLAVDAMKRVFEIMEWYRKE